MLPSVDVSDVQDEDPSVAAALVRELWGLGTKPLPNLLQLYESKGISVFRLADAAASVDAYSTRDIGKVNAQRIGNELSLPVNDVRTLMLQSEIGILKSEMPTPSRETVVERTDWKPRLHVL